jgi:hypothetical protein
MNRPRMTSVFSFPVLSVGVPRSTLSAGGEHATFCPASPTDMNSNSAVLGLWWKSATYFTINSDTDFGTADHTYTRRSPTKDQRLRATAQYRAAWLNLTACHSVTEVFRATRIQLQQYFAPTADLLYQQFCATWAAGWPRCNRAGPAATSILVSWISSGLR